MSIATYGFSQCNGIGTYGFVSPCQKRGGIKLESRRYQQIIHEWSHTFILNLHNNHSYHRTLKLSRNKSTSFSYNHIINHKLLKTNHTKISINHTLFKPTKHTQNVSYSVKKRHFTDYHVKHHIKRRHYTDFTVPLRDNTPLLLFLYLKLKQKT